MPDITTLISLFVAGAFISYVVGLIGAPSGTLYIPFLLIAMPYLYASSRDNLIPISMATATVSIIFSVIYSSYLAFREKQVEVKAIQQQWWKVLIGGFAGAIFVYFMQNQIVLLKILLGLALLGFSIAMWNHLEPEDDKDPIESTNLNVSWFLGASFVSTAFGVGGQPYIWMLLKKLYYTSRHALGTARILNLVSMTGSLVVYTVLSIRFNEDSIQLIGYFYWPAIVMFALASFPFIHLGFVSSRYLPIATMKKYYSIFTALTGIWMVGYAISFSLK